MQKKTKVLALTFLFYLVALCAAEHVKHDAQLTGYAPVLHLCDLFDPAVNIHRDYN